MFLHPKHPLATALAKLGTRGLNSLAGMSIIFYRAGAVGIIWFFFWWLLSAETPAKHATIIQDERIYIENAICETTKGVSKKVRRTAKK